MLSPHNFTIEHINELRENRKCDPGLLERTLFAFGLLEALARVELPFVFKGGTSLMLLLERPMRLSTDIDILVEPDIDVDAYIEAASKIFPFLKCDEDVRKGRNNIVKRHFRFYYDSPVQNTGLNILLDVLFEHNPYQKTVRQEIKNDLLLTDGERIEVITPDINCMLGDKLTAFAPHTTGIPFGIGKEMEIAKQMYDVSTLTEQVTDFDLVQKTYAQVVKAEIGYRGITASADDALRDSLASSMCVMGKGKIHKAEYPLFVQGITSLGSHIYGEKFNGEIAASKAARVMHLAAAMLSGQKKYSLPLWDGKLSDYALNETPYRQLNFIKKRDKLAFNIVCEAAQWLERAGISIDVK